MSASASDSASASSSAFASASASASSSTSASASSASASPRYIDQGYVELVSIIGNGAYGVVYLGIDSRYGPPSYRAIKCLRRTGLDARQRHFQRREIALHRLASAHPSIVTMDRIVEEGDHTYVVMDYGEDGDLFAMITDRQRYVGDDDLIRHVFTQLIDGISYLHLLGIAHRDVKPENIVCSQGGERVKLCDFGLATSEAVSSEFGCGSTFYIAPECLGEWFVDAPSYPTHAGDVWSLGVILVNLVCGRNPWRMASPSDESFNAFLADPIFLRRILPISKQTLYILTRIFTVDPAERISLADLRVLIANVSSFSMGEEELRYAHAAAAKGGAEADLIPEDVAEADRVTFGWSDGVEDGQEVEVDETSWEDQDGGAHAEPDGYEYELEEGEEEMFSFDHDETDTPPSLRADSGSPSPDAHRSRSASSLGCGSLPPTPQLSADDTETVGVPLDGALPDTTKLGGPAAVWDLFKKPNPHFRLRDDLRVDNLHPAAVRAGAPTSYFR